MGKYRAILADPPWRYRAYSEAKNGAVASAYDTMPTAAIARIPVGDFVAADAFLFLWGTWPKLRDAMLLLDRWGFSFVTGFPWIKTEPGTTNDAPRRGIGYWTMGATEYILIGRRGSPTQRKDVDRSRVPMGLLTGKPAVFVAPRGRRHSQKPEMLQSWVERTVDGPYLELFARRERPGWDCWGVDTGFVLSAAGVERKAPPQPMTRSLFGGTER